jgi:hypothetical protein
MNWQIHHYKHDTNVKQQNPEDGQDLDLGFLAILQVQRISSRVGSFN